MVLGWQRLTRLCNGSLFVKWLWCRLATSKEYPVESKVFHWSLGCNPWGRYLRISENGAG